jgi:hypothetical protein
VSGSRITGRRAAALAPNSRANSGSIGVWKCTVPAVVKQVAVSSAIRPGVSRGRSGAIVTR